MAAAVAACNPERLVIVEVENDDIAEEMIATLDVSTNLRPEADSIRVIKDGMMVKFPVEIGIYIPRGVSSLMVTVFAKDQQGMVVGHGSTRIDQVNFFTNRVHLCPGSDGKCPEPPPPDAGCSAGADGGVVADGGAVTTEPPSDECVNYCQQIMKPEADCPGLYPSPQACLTECALAGFPNLEVCRLGHLNSGESQNVKCAAAAIVSTACDSLCGIYCQIWTATCGELHREVTNCGEICAEFQGSNQEALPCRLHWLAQATLNRTFCDWTLPGLRCGGGCP
ncbi:MAG TPA: hypothetical protein VFH68_01415 [Polyangia bacterium]|nr:hypothetical protein [Polyangia bacterium]